MNCFRRQGFLRASRDYLLLYPDALKRWLDSNRTESLHTSVHKVKRQGKGIAANPRPLTSREREVVDLVAQGRTNREISRRLSITEQTVKNHLQSIFGKLDASNRRQACSRFAHLYENGAAGRKEIQKAAAVHLEPATSAVTRRSAFSRIDLTCAIPSDAQAG